MTSSKNRSAAALLAALSLAAGAGLVGCEKKTPEPKKPTETLKDAGKDAGKALTDAGNQAKDAAKEGVDKAKEAVKEGADAAAAKAEEAAKAAQAKLVEEGQKNLDAAKTQFDALKEKVKGLTDPLKKTALDTVVKGLDGEWAALAGKFDSLKGAKPADAPGVSNEFGGLLKKVTDGIAAAMSQFK